ncbi:hypothetical protein EDB81DRAFT_765353 [Dactylonectria macrodidyma]|uniref:Uncharacterized protein n=1 Tax=Dactylonectria macrodidyma TaxID=307937 RepID=A0A9P9IMH7_9HYPO|nr:hypothetical protein EDB81DRAFT_765353 [Dactylonectria macrodidyma]
MQPTEIASIKKFQESKGNEMAGAAKKLRRKQNQQQAEVVKGQGTQFQISSVLMAKHLNFNIRLRHLTCRSNSTGVHALFGLALPVLAVNPVSPVALILGLVRGCTYNTVLYRRQDVTSDRSGIVRPRVPETRSSPRHPPFLLDR